jgi:long-chain acyl-CoA synthetase
MGCAAQRGVLYAVPVKDGETKPNESPAYRHPKYVQELFKLHPQFPEIKTLQDMILRTFKNHKSRDFMGTRIKNADGSFGKYVFKTYGEIQEQVNNLGSGIKHMDLCPTVNDFNKMEMNFVAVYSKNREEYAVLDVTSSVYGLTLVPIYDTLGPDTVSFVFRQTGVKTVFCANSYVDGLIKEKKTGTCGSLSHLVSFENPTDSQVSEGQKAGLTILSYEAVLSAGKDKFVNYPKMSPEKVTVFSYTSGTTGEPKAAMLSTGALYTQIASLMQNPDIMIDETTVHLSYLPMAHIFERITQGYIIYSGASFGFYQGDVQKLKFDLKELRPTIFSSVPRLYNKFYDALQENINKLTGLKASLVKKAIATKLENLRNEASYSHALYDKLVFNKMKEVLGGRVKFMITASAPIGAQTLDFLKIAFCCPIMEAYGQTENVGACHLTAARDGMSGHVGGPTYCMELKVQDVPEMNYLHTDKNVEGDPTPRGEVCLRGPALFSGYYKNTEKTKEALDNDGWLHTGDVGMILPNGSLKIVDRKKNIFKLAIGEYIAAEKIENIYQRCKHVAEAFVYGDSLQHYLVGVFAPHPEPLKELAASININGSFEQLCENEQVIKKFLEEINKKGREEKLYSFELVKKAKLVPESLGVKGLLTVTFKLKRHEAKMFFKSDIDRMYAEGAKEGL